MSARSATQSIPVTRTFRLNRSPLPRRFLRLNPFSNKTTIRLALDGRYTSSLVRVQNIQRATDGTMWRPQHSFCWVRRGRNIFPPSHQFRNTAAGNNVPTCSVRVRTLKSTTSSAGCEASRSWIRSVRPITAYPSARWMPPHISRMPHRWIQSSVCSPHDSGIHCGPVCHRS